MNLNTLNTFRHRVYERREQAADALFNAVDALICEATARSFPELSLSPFFVRKWPSLYEAFEDGKIDAERLREVFVQFAPLPCARRHVFLGVDTSSLFRPEAVTSADRTLLPLPNVPEASHAVSPGWVISSVVLRPVEAGQGTFVLDSRRVESSALATEVAASQVLAVVDLLVARGLRKVDHWRSLVCLCSVSGAHDERASQLPVAGQSQSGLLSPRPRSPAWSAWGQPQGWSAVSVQRPEHTRRTRCQLGGHGCSRQAG